MPTAIERNQTRGGGGSGWAVAGSSRADEARAPRGAASNPEGSRLRANVSQLAAEDRTPLTCAGELAEVARRLLAPRADPNAAEVRLLGQPCGRGGAPPPRGGRVRTPGARWAGPPRSRVGAPVAPRARARDRLLALIL